MAFCPECEAAIDMEDGNFEEGQTLDCPECGAELEIVNINPVELDVVAGDDDEADEGRW